MKLLNLSVVIFMTSFAVIFDSCCPDTDCSPTSISPGFHQYGEVDLRASKLYPTGLLKLDFGDDKMRYVTYQYDATLSSVSHGDTLYFTTDVYKGIPVASDIRTTSDGVKIKMDPNLVGKISINYHNFNFYQHGGTRQHKKFHKIINISGIDAQGLSLLTAEHIKPNGQAETKSFYIVGSLQDNQINPSVVGQPNLEFYFQPVNTNINNATTPIVSIATEHFHTIID